jgi:hypothetical protein
MDKLAPTDSNSIDAKIAQRKFKRDGTILSNKE